MLSESNLDVRKHQASDLILAIGIRHPRLYMMVLRPLALSNKTLM